MTAITQLLESLPEEERIILTMHYIRGLSNLEIAELLGVPERAVEPPDTHSGPAGQPRAQAGQDLPHCCPAEHRDHGCPSSKKLDSSDFRDGSGPQRGHAGPQARS